MAAFPPNQASTDAIPRAHFGDRLRRRSVKPSQVIL